MASGMSVIEPDKKKNPKEERRYMTKNWRSLYSCLIASVVALGWAVPTSANAGTGPSSGCSGNNGTGFNVTSIASDNDANNVPFQVQSDSKGPYVTYTNSKTDSVVSEIQANSCDWILAFSNSASRTVALTLLYPASAPSAPPFVGPQMVQPYIISKCGKNSANNGLSYGVMTFAGQTLECAFSAAFNYNGNTYALRMNPNNYAGTNWVEVTCTGAASNLCNAWTVTPIPNAVTNPSTGQTAAIGEVVQITTAQGKTTETSLGLFYVALSVTIHK
jgi:hypothetical protein